MAYFIPLPKLPFAKGNHPATLSQTKALNSLLITEGIMSAPRGDHQSIFKSLRWDSVLRTPLPGPTTWSSTSIIPCHLPPQGCPHSRPPTATNILYSPFRRWRPQPPQSSPWLSIADKFGEYLVPPCSDYQGIRHTRPTSSTIQLPPTILAKVSGFPPMTYPSRSPVRSSEAGPLHR